MSDDKDITGEETIRSEQPIMKPVRDWRVRFCPTCGHKVLEGDRFCIRCGEYLIPYIDKSHIREWLNEDLSDEDIERLYSSAPAIRVRGTLGTRGWVPYYSDRKGVYKQGFAYRVKTGVWNWKAALFIPILAYFAKLLVVLIITIAATGGKIIFLGPSSISPEMLKTLTYIDLSTQLIFFLAAFLAVGIYTPRGTSARDKLKKLGIPIGRKDRKFWLKETAWGAAFAGIMVATVFGVEYLSAIFVELIYGVNPEKLLGDGYSSGGDLAPTDILSLVLYIILMFISVAPSEETLFRGFTQKGMETSLGPKGGILLTAFYFSMFHIYIYLIIPSLFLYLLFPYLSVSLLLGYLYYRRKNLYPAIIAHALYNSIQFIISYAVIGSVIPTPL